MKTNQLRAVPTYMNGEMQSKVHQSPVTYEPGEQLGYFKMGSTVVLVFEAPFSFEFDRQVGEKIKLGELLGSCHDDTKEPIRIEEVPQGSTDVITEG